MLKRILIALPILFLALQSVSHAQVWGFRRAYLTPADSSTNTIQTKAEVSAQIIAEAEIGVIANESIKEIHVNWAQQNTDSVSSRVTGITGSQIANNTIVNADINASAAIVGTKLASNTITDTQINWAQQNSDSIFSALPTKMKQIPFKFSFLDTVLVGDSCMVAHEPFAFTIDSIWVATNAGTVTVFFDHRAHTTPRTRGTNIETSGMVADAYEVSTTFDDATIPANAPVFLRITAVASNPKQLWGTIFARKD